MFTVKPNTAFTFCLSGKYIEALEIFKSVHYTEFKELREHQPRTLTIKHNIGNILCMLGQYSKALENLNQCIT